MYLNSVFIRALFQPKFTHTISFFLDFKLAYFKFVKIVELMKLKFHVLLLFIFSDLRISDKFTYKIV